MGTTQRAPVTNKPMRGTVSHLITRYRATPRWQELAPASRRDYDLYFRSLEDKIGEALVSDIDRDFIYEMVEAHSDKPATANKYLTMMKLLLNHAVHIGRFCSPGERHKALHAQRLAGV